MRIFNKISALALCIIIMFSLFSCGKSKDTNITESNSVSELPAEDYEYDKDYIERTLNLKNNDEQEWTYKSGTDAWILSVVSAVAYPEIKDEEGVSVCVPGAYVKGIDTDNDGNVNVASDTYSSPVKGSLVIDYESNIISENNQVYTASSAPVILNTGAAGYGSLTNAQASDEYARNGYINVSCGNRGKQDTAEDSDGNTYFTGDAPSCLADQKAAARFVKYNILLGNLPGNTDYFVSTGSSGGGAHAVMFAATSNSEDFYDYEIAVGAVGVYKNDDGTYSTAVDIDGKEYEISDGAWGCIAYSPITSLYEADMAMAFEYYMDTDYDFSTSFQAKLAEYLSDEYMEYINDQHLSIKESDIGFDLDGDGKLDGDIPLSIECDKEKYPETNGYHGTYLDLYLAEFEENLKWYLDNLDYAEGWTWFDENGNALSDDEVSNMTSKEKALSFIEGRYAKASSQTSSGSGEIPNGGDITGGPKNGTSQSAGGKTDSDNYSSYDEMLGEYKKDIERIQAGDKYGRNIVSLYNPFEYISSDTADCPVWVHMIMGAAEGDMSMLSSLNLQIAFINSGVDADLQWQWDGGHVPSEIFGESFSLYLDKMYGKYISGANECSKKPAESQTVNGTAEKPDGTDIGSWVDYSNPESVKFSLSDAASYRTDGASKAIPGFDVIDYGQEDYVFGNTEKDARHWDQFLLDVLEKHREDLEPLFNN